MDQNSKQWNEMCFEKFPSHFCPLIRCIIYPCPSTYMSSLLLVSYKLFLSIFIHISMNTYSSFCSLSNTQKWHDIHIFITISIHIYIYISPRTFSQQNIGSISFFFLFLAVPCNMQDLSSPTRDGTSAPCSGSIEP